MARGLVLVTGASRGIGRAIALELDRSGFRVVAGVRDPVDGEAVRRLASGRLEVVRLDVTEAADRNAVANRLAELSADRASGGLRGLVNNAGVTIAGPLERFPLHDLRRTLEVDLVAPIALGQVLLPLLRRAHGRIVNIGSRAARLPLPFYGPYAAAKAGLAAASEAWRLELRPWGVAVILVEPGIARTAIWDGARDSAAGLLAVDEEARLRYGRLAEDVARNGRRLERAASSPESVAAVVRVALTARRPRARYRAADPPASLALLALTRLPVPIRDAIVAATLPSLRRRR